MSSVPEKHTEKVDMMKSILSELEIPSSHSILDKNISSKEIISACQKLRNGNSNGSDSILNELVKYGVFSSPEPKAQLVSL